MKSLPEENKSLNSQIKQWIDESKQQIAVSVNSTMALLYWRIGKRIKEEILQDKRAEYGKQVVANLSRTLTLEYGKGWSEQQLRHCLRSADVFPDYSILYALSIELSWTHIRKLMFIDDELKRSFYIEICKNENWSSRTLSERIDSMLYERTAISRKPEQTIKDDLSLLKEERKMTPEMVFRDPLFLDFLGLQNTYSEKDEELVELLELSQSGIHVANYYTELPPVDWLKSKLNQSIEASKQRFSSTQ